MYENEANQSRPIGYASQAKDTPDRPLDRIGIAADRLDKLGSLVGEFLDRFDPRPPVPMTTSGGGGISAAPGYNSHLTRLFDNLDRLESAVHQLGNIG